MVTWKQSAIRPGTFVSFDLRPRSVTYPRVAPSNAGWVAGYLSDDEYVTVAGPFETKEQAMLAAELLFE